MERVTLYQEYRLIERNENDISVAWKGAHLLLFFLAFVFGSFCTFCMHILMYMFDQKCVLFPKIVKHPSLHHIVYEYFSINAEKTEDAKTSTLPIDYLNTHWVENSVCYLPTYVPLVSGLFGLVWTTMFLMCSSGTSNPTGMQRQWRALPAIFVFSVAMGGICIYASSITHDGLEDLCTKLAEVTGSPSCTFTVNVVTLVYERRIRGVFQATQLTIATAWLHTLCWLLSALITTLRVLFAVDFQLVCVKAELIGNVERMLEKYEQQIRFIAPESTAADTSAISMEEDTASFELNEENTGSFTIDMLDENLPTKKRYFAGRSTIFISQIQEQSSELSLVPEECFKLARITALDAVPYEHQFIVKIIYDLLETINLRSLPHIRYKFDTSSELFGTSTITRQRGRENITASTSPRRPLNPEEAEKIALKIREDIRKALTRHFHVNSEWNVADVIDKHESSFNLYPELQEAMGANLNEGISKEAGISEPILLRKQVKKSNLKSKSVQVSGIHKVQILDTVQSYETDEEDKDSSTDTEDTTDETSEDDNEETNENNDHNEDDKKSLSDKETQTIKEKQD